MIMVDDVENWTSELGFVLNRAGPTQARKRLGQITDHELITGNEDALVSLITMSPTEEETPAVIPKHGENVRRQTAPSRLPVPTSGVFIANYGSGDVDSSDVGNIEDSYISNVGNNNSKNYSQPGPRSQSTYPMKGKKPAMPPRQKVRGETVPSLFPGSTSIHNYGSGTVKTSNAGNIKNSSISNVGNNNSKNYFQSRPKPTYPGDGH